jgi:hypothetical protein
MDSPSICFYSSNDDLPLILTWGLRAWNINGNPNCGGLSAISRKRKPYQCQAIKIHPFNQTTVKEAVCG